MDAARVLDAIARVRSAVALDPEPRIDFDALLGALLAPTGATRARLVEIEPVANGMRRAVLRASVGLDDAGAGPLDPDALRWPGFVSLPLRAAGRLVGVAAIAGDPGRAEAALATSLAPVLAACADAIALVRTATAERRAAFALQRRIEIDALVVDLSHQFLDLPSVRTDDAIVAALARVAKFTGADRAVLDLLSENRGRLLRTHAWGAAVPERIEQTGQSTSDLPDWAIRFALEAGAGGSTGSIEVAALPVGSPVREALSLLAVRHIAWLIARVNGEPVGAIVLSWMQSACELDPAELPALSPVADILTAAERRKQADRALRESEERFRRIADAAPLLVWSCDAEGRLEFVNRFGLEFAGSTQAELAGRALLTPVHPEDVQRLLDAFVEARAARRPFEVEFRTERADGQIRSLLMCGGPVIGADGALRGFVGSSVDITERKRLEEDLAQAQKLEAVGRLAGGIAHDFNNLLTAVLGHVESGRLALREGSSPGADLDEIDAAAKRAAALTRQLLAFASRQRIMPRVVDVNEIVAGVETLLRRLLGEHVLLDVALDPATGCVHVDPGQLEQVLINLAANARDAMPGGGRLCIETARVAAADSPADATNAPRGWVRLLVRDTGTGMDEATLARAFEPFFTTKELGRGTGLGLATCYGIVRQSQGHIAVLSEVGTGTTFEILLPAVDPARVDASAHAAEPVTALPSQETLLVVEDEPAVRRLTTRMLRRMGYRVLEAADGVDAERVLEVEGDAIDLLVTDVVMPRRSGPQLAAWARSRWPKLRVLFISGYTDTLTRELAPGHSFLAKPFTLERLAEQVRQALDGSSDWAARASISSSSTATACSWTPRRSPVASTPSC